MFEFASVHKRVGRTAARLIAATSLIGLAACSGETETANRPLTAAEEAIKVKVDGRQANFQDLGAAFKAIRDEMQAGRPESTTVQFSVRSVAGYANQMQNWFDEGTGPESGFEMEAKAEIWAEADAFAQHITDFQSAVAELSAASEAGDAAALAQAVRAVGGQCKACHDRYREED